MRNKTPVLASALLAAAAFAAMSPPPFPPALAQPAPGGDKPVMNSEVAAVCKQITAAYQNLKSYQHTEVYTLQAKTRGGERKLSQKYVLAAERPNKFLFKFERADQDAAVSDGKTFINFRSAGNVKEYTKAPAPATIKEINLVEDVQFEPRATYLVALALQGDILADKDMTRLIAQAKMGPNAQEGGKTFQTLVIASAEGATMTLYVDAGTHLLGKVVQQFKANSQTLTEQIEDVQINKPLDAAIFKYTPPESSRMVHKLTDPR